MQIWFSEYHTKDVRFSFRLERELFSGTSEFQDIKIVETPEFGRVLLLDDCLMLTEKDEFIYHEMMTHLPLAVHPDPRRILVIGGGDGGVVRELVRYPEVEAIDMVEIDELVVSACREHLPSVAAAFDDPRLNLMFADGLQYVRRQNDCYDVIIVDSTDPFGPGESLFTREFYGNCSKALKENGVLVNQHESPYYRADAREVTQTHRKTSAIFPISKVFQAHVPTYPSGHWLFGFCSKHYDPIADLDAERWNARSLETHYYNTDLHVGCFALPTYVRQLLRG